MHFIFLVRIDGTMITSLTTLSEITFRLLRQATSSVRFTVAEAMEAILRRIPRTGVATPQETVRLIT